MNDEKILLIGMILFAIGLLIVAKYLGEKYYNPIFSYTWQCFFVLIIRGNVFNDMFRAIIFFMIMLFSFGIYQLYLLTENGKELKNNTNIDKCIVIYISLISTISSMSFYIFKSIFEISIFTNADDFRKLIIIGLFFTILYIILRVRDMLKYIFKGRDRYRNIYILLESLFLIIYIAETIYINNNIDKLKLISF